MASETITERRERLYRDTRNCHGVAEWHSDGFKGKGVGFLELEGDTEHCKMVLDQFRDIAPLAKTFSGGFSYRLTNGVLRDFKLNTPDGKKHDLQQYVKDNNIQIIGQSIYTRTGGAYDDSILDELRKTGCIFLSAAGNDDEVGVNGKIRDIAINVGAVELKNGELVREGYSASGDVALDFATLHGPFEGTSFAQPMLSGMVALILEREGPKTQDEIYATFKSMCEQKEHNTDFGWGIPRFQNWKEEPEEPEEPEKENEEMEIKCKIGSNKVMVDGQENTLDFPLFEVGGTSLLPVRLLSEAFGATVSYDSETKEIIIKK